MLDSSCEGGLERLTDKDESDSQWIDIAQFGRFLQGRLNFAEQNKQ